MVTACVRDMTRSDAILEREEMDLAFEVCVCVCVWLFVFLYMFCLFVCVCDFEPMITEREVQ